MSNSFPQRPLQYGIFDWIERDALSPSETFENRLKMLEYADQNGFAGYHVAEHHIAPLSVSPSPSLFLAAAAQRTKRIRLGPMVYLLPFYHPLRLIEEVIMLDHLSHGRLDLAVGRGIVPMEAEPFGVDSQDSVNVTREILDIMVKAFTSDTLNYEGKYYNFKDIRMWMHPYQKPLPPIWWASNTFQNVPWIAQHGFNTLHALEPASNVKPHFDLYKQVWEEHQEDTDRFNGHVKEPIIGLFRHVYVAPTDAQALKECKEAHKAWFYNMNFLWDKAGNDFVRSQWSDFDVLMDKEVMAVGSPQTVQKMVKRDVEETGINYFCPCFSFGDLTHEQVMKSMSLFVDEVIPAVK